MDIKILLKELDRLNLPKDQYAIFGSGPVGIRNLKESNDLDIIVKDNLWQELIKKYPVVYPNVIKINNVELGKGWFKSNYNINELINTADIIQGYRFVKLEYVLDYKKNFNREKDIQDIKIIKEYLKTKN